MNAISGRLERGASKNEAYIVRRPRGGAVLSGENERLVFLVQVRRPCSRRQDGLTAGKTRPASRWPSASQKLLPTLVTGMQSPSFYSGLPLGLLDAGVRPACRRPSVELSSDGSPPSRGRRRLIDDQFSNLCVSAPLREYFLSRSEGYSGLPLGFRDAGVRPACRRPSCRRPSVELSSDGSPPSRGRRLSITLPPRTH
jgi:hypothetical protein